MSLSDRIKTASYLLKPAPYALEKPVVLQFPVIDICNSQCQMCRIWENKKSEDITPEELARALRDPLFSEVSSVGLNGGEPTLRKDLGELTAVLFQSLPKLRAISLITNAYRVEEVTARIADVGAVVRGHGGHLDVMVSLDGVGEVHDRVRGKPGNFDRAQRVIDFLRSCGDVGTVRIGCTIIKENVHGLPDLLEWCMARDLYVKYRLGIPHQRLYTQDLTDPYALTTAEKYEVTEFLEGLIAHYESSESQRFFYRSLIDQMVHGQPRRAGCDWQHRGATITSRGELLYCAVQSRPLGRIQDGESERAYFDNAAHLQEIVRDKCATCNHDYVGIPPKPQYAKQLLLEAARRIGAEPLGRRIYHSRQLQSLRAPRAFAARQRALQALPAMPRSARSGVPRVLLCGWYGTETLGDKAILAGVLAALRGAVGPIEPALVSLFPYVSEMTRRQMPELKGCRIVTVEQGVRQASDADLVVFAGGPLMAVDALADMEAIFLAARAAGVPTVLAGCGVGPLGTKWHDRALASLLSLSTVRVFRDEPSRALAGRLGVDTSADAVAEDPAFSWLAAQRDLLPAPEPTGRKVLLLGLRDFPLESYARHLPRQHAEAMRGRYEAAVLQALETLSQTHADLVVQPLPMCTNHYGDDDRWFYRRLLRSRPALHGRLDLSLLGPELTPAEYCKAFLRADVLLGMRFHSLVFALGLNLPAVAIDYTLGRGKVHALAERFGMPCRSLEQLDAEFIVHEVDAILEERVPIVEPVKPRFGKVLARALAAVPLMPAHCVAA